MLLTLASGTASAQAADPNPGAITLTTGIDFPSIYFFRGIRQEVDPAFTTFAFGDVGIALQSGDGALKSTSLNFGLWNSLNTGSSGSKISEGHSIHYEEDFYVSMSMGFGGGVTLTPMFTMYTSPGGVFTTVKELSFKLAHASRFAPYALFAFELGGDDSGQADGGHLAEGNKGTYMELGAAPSFPLGGGGATLGVPIKLGFSLNDYYESPVTGEDSAFGYFDIGALITLPLSSGPTKFGSWNIHGGFDYLALGGTNEELNIDKDGDTSSSAFVFSVGIGLSY